LRELLLLALLMRLLEYDFDFHQPNGIDIGKLSSILLTQLFA